MPFIGVHSFLHPLCISECIASMHSCVFSAGQSATAQKQSEMGRARIMGNETKLNMNDLCTRRSQQKSRYSSATERIARDKLKKILLFSFFDM